jgi:hypothetical protein
MRRYRWQQAARLAGPVLAGGLSLTLLLIMLGRFYLLAHPVVLLAVGLTATAMLLFFGLVYLWLAPYSAQSVARHIDRRLKLAERLTTAVELAISPGQTPAAIVQNQWQDTQVQLKAFDPALVFPLRLGWPWLLGWALLAAAIVAGLILPNPQLERLEQLAHNEAVITAEAEQLAVIRADLVANEALVDTAEGQAALQTLDDLLETLRESNLSPEEALAALSEAEAELAELQNEADRSQTLLNDLAKTFNQFESTARLAQALQRRDLARAAQFLDSAATGLGQTPAAAQNELAQALEQAAAAAQAAGDAELAQSLQQAAEALQQNASPPAGSTSQSQQAAQTALEQAAQALAKAQSDPAGQEALQRALNNIQQAREQLAESGGDAGPDSQPGSGDQGQAQPGQQADRGGGDNPAPGLDDGSGAGRNEANDAAEDLFADRPGDEADIDNGPNEGRLGQYDPRYPPIHWGGEGGPLLNPEAQGATGGLPIGPAPVDPNQPARPAQVPYNQVYGQYADAAGEALEDTYVPLGLKEYVRNYFGALEPGQ